MSSTRSAKRKATEEQSSSAINGNKKSRRAGRDIGDLELRFEWEGDQIGQVRKWIQYTREFNERLTQACKKGNKQVELTVTNGPTLVVVFDKMEQKNKKTNWTRDIRVGIKGAKDNDFMVTLWEEQGIWYPYSLDTSLEIATALEEGKTTVETETTPVPYKIDLNKWTQTNIETGFSRKLKREIAVSDVSQNAEAEKMNGKKEPNKSEEEEKPKKGSKSAGASKKVKEEVKEEEEKPKSGRGKAKSQAATKSAVRTVVIKKGSAPVDSLCPVADKVSVYECEDDDDEFGGGGTVVWDCMLNQTNIANNNNKYFAIQLLKEDGKEMYYVWFRWGRVGYNGQNKLNNCGSLAAAKKMFEKKFSDKTGNDWFMKDMFEKVPGKYDLLKMDYSGDKNEDQVDSRVKVEEEEKTKTPDSKLDKKLQDLINLICDIKSMEDAVMEMKYDAKKAPLGKLTKDQIKAGYTALKKIEALIRNGDTGSNLSSACSEFYTRIPHWFGMQTPPLIRTSEMVKQKLALLEALEDIEIAIKMLKGGDQSENPVDRHYHQLNCQLDALDHSAEEFQQIDKYLQQTHASTHNMYKMQLVDVYKCEKTSEHSKFQDLGNRMLLWHGSRLTNWAGILGQGLRIAPPEAPVTGYMFGKGVYFADMSSKSANYCFATKSKNTGLMLLCDVSLGNTEDKMAADYNAAKLPKGKNSVRGLGRVAPDPKQSATGSDGMMIPMGHAKDTGVVNPKGYTLNYNEFIVYDTTQIRMKYLVQVEFNFR